MHEDGIMKTLIGDSAVFNTVASEGHIFVSCLSDLKRLLIHSDTCLIHLRVFLIHFRLRDAKINKKPETLKTKRFLVNGPGCIDTHIIINMNIEDYIKYYLLCVAILMSYFCYMYCY